MAARSHVDVTVSERRLRPIYDYLDNENNRKAQQEAEKLIKKQKDPKDVLCAKALKALALIRLSRQDEAQIVIKEVHLEGPTDDATLRAMTICYWELHKPELIADAYERAVKKDPQNEELLSHLFMSYVRNSEYKKQQQTAMLLYKLKPKNPYYFWAVMSIVMQATSGDEKLAKSMLLPLAERMAVKFVNEKKIEAEAEVQLHLMILELQEKYEEALNVLDGPLKDHLSGYLDTMTQKKAELLNKMGKWPLANAAYKKLIMSNPDQWSYYVDYFSTLTKIVESGWEPKENSDTLDADYSYDQAIDLLAALVEEQNRSSDNRILRGPYLAQIELLRQLIDKKDERASRIGSAVDIIASYYEKFGSKPSCFLDLSHVLNTLSLTSEEISDLLGRMKAIVPMDGSKEKLADDLKEMYYHLCYSQLCHFLGLYHTWEDSKVIAHSETLLEHYENGLKFGSTLLPTEFQPCDNYCFLVAHSLIHLWTKTNDDKYFNQILIVLEQGLKNSPSNFQLKLLLLKLYNIIGAVGTSFSLYESVDVKHIQQETLGYLITDPLLSAAFFTTASIILGTSMRFFIGNYKDTVDYLISCYKYGSFTKIPEIVKFREKLNNSLHYSLITVERMIIDLLLETKGQQGIEKAISFMDIDPENDKSLDNLTDNRDVSILRVWSAKDKKEIEDQLEKSFQEKVVWLKIRNITIRCIAAVFYLTQPSTHSNNSHHNEESKNGEKRGMSEILSDLLSNLNDTIENVDTSDLLQSIFPIQAPGPTRLLRYLQGNYIHLFISMAELALNLYRIVEDSADAEEKSCLKAITDLKKHFQALPKRIEQPAFINQGLVKVKTYLEDCTNSIEAYSFSTILFSLIHNLLKPARNSLMRKGKKKKENVPHVTTEIFQELDSLHKAMDATGNTLTDLLNQFDTLNAFSSFESLSLSDNPEKLENREVALQQIKTNVETSYQTSLKELKEVLQTKLKHIQSLKW